MMVKSRGFGLPPFVSHFFADCLYFVLSEALNIFKVCGILSHESTLLQNGEYISQIVLRSKFFQLLEVALAWECPQANSWPGWRKSGSTNNLSQLHGSTLQKCSYSSWLSSHVLYRPDLVLDRGLHYKQVSGVPSKETAGSNGVITAAPHTDSELPGMFLSHSVKGGKLSGT